jgi:hypothetical protein
MKVAFGGQKNADEPHSMGTMEPSMQNEPAGQFLHLTWPGSSWKEPAGHLKHVSEPADGWYAPAGHA